MLRCRWPVDGVVSIWIPGNRVLIEIKAPCGCDGRIRGLEGGIRRTWPIGTAGSAGGAEAVGEPMDEV